MDHDICRLEPTDDFQLKVVLVDGRRGTFDVRPDLHLPGLSALRDPACFRRVQVLFGAATWPDGEDISPATLATELKSEVSA